MELKFNSYLHICIFFVRSNRTFMELKYADAMILYRTLQF